MRTILAGMLLGLSAAAVAHAASTDREAQRLADAREAFREILAVEDAQVPKQLLDGCRCVAVFPGVVKGAIGWGARHGRGVISCRQGRGWSPPSFLTITGGSVGFQLGIEKTDLVLFVMNEKGARSLVQDEFTLGAKGAVAAGPLGRSAEGATDVKLDAEIYSYARSKGLFAGLSLEGARVNGDRKAIKSFYGAALEPKAILFEGKAPRVPVAAKAFLDALP